MKTRLGLCVRRQTDEGVTTLFKSAVAGHLMPRGIQFIAIRVMFLQDLSASHHLVKMLNGGLMTGVSSGNALGIYPHLSPAACAVGGSAEPGVGLWDLREPCQNEPDGSISQAGTRTSAFTWQQGWPQHKLLHLQATSLPFLTFFHKIFNISSCQSSARNWNPFEIMSEGWQCSRLFVNPTAITPAKSCRG